jgi:hypothetical protein
MSMKNSSDTIGNRTRDLPACSTVPQSTAQPRTQMSTQYTVEKGNKHLERKESACIGHMGNNSLTGYDNEVPDYEVA